MNNQLATMKQNLTWSEAVRAFICMLPMLTMNAMGKTTYLVTLGQGAFFFSSLFLPKKIGARFVMGSLILSIGLGFYLIGGTVAPYPLLAVLFMFITGLSLSYLSNWKIGGPLALTLVVIFTAGLNTGSPEKASANFLVFALVLGWSMVISMLPFWKPIEPPAVNTEQTNAELTEQGFRLGLGTSIALAFSFIADFAKLGWAPSAVGNVVRYDQQISKKRAWARLIGTVGGATLAGLALTFITTVSGLVYIGTLFAVLNGLFKKTILGMMPLFYTATILLLYTANDMSRGTVNIWQRIAYNIVGITIGMLVVTYPFPAIVSWIRSQTKG